MFIVVLWQHVSILIESSSGPCKNTDPYLAMFLAVFLEGPEDDSIRTETCRPNTVINIINLMFIGPCIIVIFEE